MAFSDHDLVFLGSDVQEIQAVGRYIRIREATSSVYLTIDGSGEIVRAKGEQIDVGKNSYRVRIRSTVAQNVSVVSSDTPQDDNRNSVSLTVNATVTNGNDNAHLAKVAVGAGVSALIAAANVNRKSLRVSLLSDAAGYVTLGKLGVTATAGGTLEAGMVDYIDTEGALYAFNPNAVPVDVWVMEINKL
jgi:hypothetical protein